MNSWAVIATAFAAGGLTSWLPYGSVAVGPVQVSFGVQTERSELPLDIHTHCVCTASENQSCPETRCAATELAASCGSWSLSATKLLLLSALEGALCVGVIGYHYEGFGLAQWISSLLARGAHSEHIPLAIEEHVDQEECDRSETGGPVSDQLHNRQDIISRAHRARPRSIQTIGGVNSRA